MPPTPIDLETEALVASLEEREQRRRRLRRERQQRWRERTAGRADEPASTRLGASVTLHLTDRECAVLDMLAAELYRDNPHDPAEGVLSEVFPGRPAAVRLLIERFRAQHKVRRPASRVACAMFWRTESAFRKAFAENTRAEKPEPPW